MNTIHHLSVVNTNDWGIFHKLFTDEMSNTCLLNNIVFIQVLTLKPQWTEVQTLQSLLYIGNLTSTDPQRGRGSWPLTSVHCNSNLSGPRQHFILIFLEGCYHGRLDKECARYFSSLMDECEFSVNAGATLGGWNNSNNWIEWNRMEWNWKSVMEFLQWCSLSSRRWQ